jgi:hypothetical protein
VAARAASMALTDDIRRPFSAAQAQPARETSCLPATTTEIGGDVASHCPGKSRRASEASRKDRLIDSG